MMRDSTDTADSPSREATAPPFCCAISVTTHDAADSMRNGVFSVTSRQMLAGRRVAEG